MPLTDDEERLKLAWEVALMDTQIDRGRFDIEKIRLDIDKTHLEIEKYRQDLDKTRTDMALDGKRFWLQAGGLFATMLAAIAGAFAAGATWWNYFHH